MAALTLVAVPPEPADDGTTLRVTPGTGAEFGAVPFPAVVLPFGAAPTVANAELVLVTEASPDAWVVLRRRAGAARAILTGDRVVGAPTIEAASEALALPRAAPAFLSVTTTLASPRVYDVRFDRDS